MADPIDELEGKSDPDTKDDAGKPDAKGDGKPGDKSPAGKKRDRRNQMIIIGLTAVGLVIGYLSLRKSSSASGTAAAATGSSGLDASNYPGTGTVAGSSGSSTDPNASSGLATLLQQMQSEISQLQAGTPAAGDGTTVPTSTTSPYSTTPWSGTGFDIADAGQLTYLQDDVGKKWYQVLPTGQIFQLSTQQINAVEAQYPNITIKHFNKAPVPGAAPVSTPKATSGPKATVPAGTRQLT